MVVISTRSGQVAACPVKVVISNEISAIGMCTPIFDYPTVDRLGISRGELHKLIKDLKNKTAPGRSGLDKTVLLWFIQYFPETFTAYIGDLIRNPQWELDPDTEYLKIRKIIFLAKKNKDAQRVENYRPIALLETVYKIISKFLIEKISPGVYQAVSKDGPLVYQK